MAHPEQTPPAPARDREFLVTLPYRSEQIDDTESNFDVSVWRCSDNFCEHRGLSNCESVSGLYYGSAEEELTMFCPRHFFAMHAGPNAAYRLIDLAAPHGKPGRLGDPTFVALLPWVSTIEGEEHDPTAAVLDQAAWRCSRNVCDCAGDGWCDGTGFYYGTSDEGEPKFCARHFFSGIGYALIDLAPAEHKAAVLQDACERASHLLGRPDRDDAMTRRAQARLRAAIEQVARHDA